MTTMTMISVAYDRIPEKVLYKAKINVDAVTVEEGADATEEGISRKGKSAATMEEIIEELHELLKQHPDAQVTMVRGTTRPMHFGQRKPRGFELDEKMRDLIRDDLDKAKEAFAPIEHTIQVRPAPPRIPIKE
jgi:hypothetical protein